MWLAEFFLLRNLHMFQGLGAGSVRIFAMWALTLGVSLVTMSEIQTMSNFEAAASRALTWLE